MQVWGGVDKLDIKVFMPIYFCGYLPTLVPVPIVRVVTLLDVNIFLRGSN